MWFNLEKWKLNAKVKVILTLLESSLYQFNTEQHSAMWYNLEKVKVKTEIESHFHTARERSASVYCKYRAAQFKVIQFRKSES